VFTASDCPDCLRLAPEMKNAAAADPELGFFLLSLKEHAALAKELGIRRTPTLVFPDGRTRAGFLPAEAITQGLGE
jgi:thiol-disulfide isomerase/thioredoxin